MYEIKQIIDPLFIEKIKRISVLLEEISKIETELKSLDVNLEVRIDSWNS
jgi:hypothetical protein